MTEVWNSHLQYKNSYRNHDSTLVLDAITSHLFHYKIMKCVGKPKYNI